jgi:hypothetical protein
MKQGTGRNSDSGRKVEPKSHKVSPGAVGSIGTEVVRTVSKPMFPGRGYEAPKAGHQSHPRGSQGKH